jgi:hypothetical protein
MSIAKGPTDLTLIESAYLVSAVGSIPDLIGSNWLTFDSA